MNKTRINCKICGKLIWIWNYRRHTARYCSFRCRGLDTSKGSKNHNWKGTAICSCGAKKKHTSKRCQKCYFKERQGKNHPNWKGGWMGKNGYKYISDKLEHRLMMEQKLNRKLVDGETVHHLNKIRNDNRPENLELCVSHSEHMKHHHQNSGINTRFKKRS